MKWVLFKSDACLLNCMVFVNVFVNSWNLLCKKYYCDQITKKESYYDAKGWIEDSIMTVVLKNVIWFESLVSFSSLDVLVNFLRINNDYGALNMYVVDPLVCCTCFVMFAYVRHLQPVCDADILWVRVGMVWFQQLNCCFMCEKRCDFSGGYCCG